MDTPTVGAVVTSPAYAGDRIGIVIDVAPLVGRGHALVRWSNGYTGWTSTDHLVVVA